MVNIIPKLYSELLIKLYLKPCVYLFMSDNVPVCPVPEYEQHVPESALPGTFLLIIEAYDPDYSNNTIYFEVVPL